MKSKTEKKEKAASVRLMGKETGYEVRDGSYILAPCHRERMNDLMSQEAGVSALVKSVSEFASKEFTRIRREQSDWWRRVADDVGLDTKKVYAWNGGSGAVYEIKKEEAEQGKS